MNIQEWEEQFKPVVNHLDENASWQNEYGVGIMFETYGAEEQYVFDQDPLKVWTYVDGDDGGTYLVSGRCFINRIGYFVCEVPYDDAIIYEIQVQEPDDELCEMCESNEKESPEGKWCTSCKDDYKESDND